MTRILYLLLLGTPLLPSGIWAQGRAPEEEPQRPKKSDKSLKQSANEALEDVNRGVRRAGKVVKEEGTKALNAVDEGVHELIESDKH